MLNYGLLFGGASFLAFAAGLPAYAQEPATSDQRNTVSAHQGEIIVTAQRRQESLQDVPVALSVVSGEDITERGLRNLEDLTSRLPNIRISQAPGSDQIFIRGVGSGINLGFEQSVATFVDGVYRSRARASRLAFFDIERVEVLRGPQTTFFGNNAIAGALNITTRKPGDRFEYNARALYAPADGEYAFEGGVSFPVSQDFSMRLAGSIAGMDGYIYNTRLGTDGPSQESQLGRVAVHWEPGSTFSVDARIDVGRVRDTDVFNAELRSCPPDPVYGTPRGACGRFIAAEGAGLDDRLNYVTDVGPSQFDLDYVEAVVEASAEIGNHRLTSTSAYYTHDYFYSADVLPGAPNASAVGTFSGLPTRSGEDFEQFSQEVRFESVGYQPVEYMAGLYFAHSKFHAPTGSGFYFAPLGAFTGGEFQPGDPIALYFHNSQTDDLISAFASSTINLSRDLRLGAGFRYSTVKKEVHRSAVVGVGDNDLTEAGFTPGTPAGQAIIAALTGTAMGDFVNPERRDSKFMPALNLEYDATEDVMLYASYSKGFKAGGYAVGASRDSFEPETVDSFEVGAKSRLFNGRLTLNLAAFYSEYKGLQESTFFINGAGTPIPTIDNAAQSVSKGVEAGGALSITDDLIVNFDLAYLSSKYDDYPLAPCPSEQSLTTPNCTQDLSGQGRAFAPEWSGSVGFDYRTRVFSDLRFELGSSVFFTSSYYQDVSRDRLLRQPRYAKIDARVAIGSDDDQWNVAVIGKNLTDKATAGVRRPLPSSPVSYLALPDRPRSVALQLTVRR